MTQATISSKGQLAIPKAIRERLSLKPGTKVTLDVRGEQIVLKRLTAGFPDWRTMRGMVRSGAPLTRALEQEHREELAREEKKVRRS